MLYKPIRGREGGIYWYVLQTHSAAEVAFNRFWDENRKSRVNNYGDLIRDRGILKEKPNESEKRCTILNDANIHFKSGENFDDLRVETLDGAVVDEYRQQHPALWPTVIRPMLARRNGWADIYSTPNGYEHFYDLYQAALQNPEWGCFAAPSTEAWWWTPEEIESARSTMSEDEFAQEILAEFREIGIGKVYKNHGSWNQCTQNPFALPGSQWSKHLPLVVGVDFNVGLMAWEIGQFRGPESYCGYEIAVKNTNTQECAPILLNHVRNHKAGVIILGDASGKARRSSATESDYQIIMSCLKNGMPGIPVRNLTPESNPPIRDRTNAVNASLKTAGGGVLLRYHPGLCTYLKKDFERVVWKANIADAIFDKSDPERTHASDAWGYPVTAFSNQWKPKPGKMRVLQR